MKYPPQQIEIEYDSRGQRARKCFTDPYIARRFYASKLREGKNPRVLKGRA